ncbi:MAG TPA: YkvA family protein [Cyclobacteriaceae bacterium]|nr:YkvA family protein [Cyclobacteriaceae bacterium]
MNTHKEKESRLFAKVKRVYQSRAESIAANREKLSKLLHKFSDKMKQVGEMPSIRESKSQLEVFYRMLKAHLNNSYRGVSNRTLVLLVLGLLYFVLPLDFIPDFIPGVGYIDDLTVIVAIFKSLNTDIEKFLEWERTKA